MRTLRLFLGYLVGFSVFVVLIPSLLVQGAQNSNVCLSGTLFTSDFLRWAVSLPMFGIGVLFAIWSNVFLLDKGKGGPVDAFNLSISPRSKFLVTTGPYRLCRHPMVFGTICLYGSISLYLNSLHDFVVVAAVIPLFILFLRFSEEKRLLRDFGEAYVVYQKSVPMIVPFTKFKKKK